MYELSAQILQLTGLVRPDGVYSFLKWLDLEAESLTGSGFRARVLEDQIKDG